MLRGELSEGGAQLVVMGSSVWGWSADIQMEGLSSTQLQILTIIVQMEKVAIEILEIGTESIRFALTGCDVSLANALRRIMISEHRRKHLRPPRRVPLPAHRTHPLRQRRGRRLQVPLGVLLRREERRGLPGLQGLLHAGGQEHWRGGDGGDLAPHPLGLRPAEERGGGGAAGAARAVLLLAQQGGAHRHPHRQARQEPGDQDPFRGPEGHRQDARQVVARLPRHLPARPRNQGRRLHRPHHPPEVRHPRLLPRQGLRGTRGRLRSGQPGQVHLLRRVQEDGLGPRHGQPQELPPHRQEEGQVHLQGRVRRLPLPRRHRQKGHGRPPRKTQGDRGEHPLMILTPLQPPATHNHTLQPSYHYQVIQMGPKKDAKNAVEEPPKEVEPEPQPFELVGYGRFEYLSGVVYEGNWKLVKGVKTKHGYGRLLLPFDPQVAAVQEAYEGNWEEDQMEGYGTYSYADGAVYSGQWAKGRHHGRGKLKLANGTEYDGSWQEHAMHGSGCYVDHLGRKWEGEFREGVFESRRQVELSKEKVLLQRREELREEVKATITKMVTILEAEHSDAKIAPFFAASDHVRSLISGELPNLHSKPKEEWLEWLKLAQTGETALLQRRADCKTIPSDRLLVRQQQGDGQVAEVFFNRGGQKCGLLLLQTQKGRWMVAAANQLP